MLACGGAEAAFRITLKPETVEAWNDFLRRVEPGMGSGFGTELSWLQEPQRSAGLATLRAGKPVVVDLNPGFQNGGKKVPDGAIHHWIGAGLIPNTDLAKVEATLKDYAHYAETYCPDIKFAEATPEGNEKYNVHVIFERFDGQKGIPLLGDVGMHFAYHIYSHVTWRRAHGTTFVDTRAYRIQETDKGVPPYEDKLPEGIGHGVLWRTNTYWRLRQLGPSVYAEFETLSLSRTAPPGLGGTVKSKTRTTMTNTLQQVADRTLGRKVTACK
jgi:hypothetical protein